MDTIGTEESVPIIEVALFQKVERTMFGERKGILVREVILISGVSSKRVSTVRTSPISPVPLQCLFSYISRGD